MAKTYIWQLRNPDGGPKGLEFAMGSSAPTDVMLGHAPRVAGPVRPAVELGERAFDVGERRRDRPRDRGRAQALDGLGRPVADTLAEREVHSGFGRSGEASELVLERAFPFLERSADVHVSSIRS